MDEQLLKTYRKEYLEKYYFANNTNKFFRTFCINSEWISLFFFILLVGYFAGTQMNYFLIAFLLIVFLLLVALLSMIFVASSAQNFTWKKVYDFRYVKQKYLEVKEYFRNKAITEWQMNYDIVKSDRLVTYKTDSIIHNSTKNSVSKSSVITIFISILAFLGSSYLNHSLEKMKAYDFIDEMIRLLAINDPKMVEFVIVIVGLLVYFIIVILFFRGYVKGMVKLSLDNKYQELIKIIKETSEIIYKNEKVKDMIELKKIREVLPNSKKKISEKKFIDLIPNNYLEYSYMINKSIDELKLMKISCEIAIHESNKTMDFIIGLYFMIVVGIYTSEISLFLDPSSQIIAHFFTMNIIILIIIAITFIVGIAIYNKVRKRSSYSYYNKCMIEYILDKKTETISRKRNFHRIPKR